MLPRINDAIGHLKLTQIRPQHLNDFYKTLSENGVRNLGAIAVAKKVLKKKVEALGQPKHVIAKESGIAHTTLNAILKGDAVKLETAEGIAKALGYTVSELGQPSQQAFSQNRYRVVLLATSLGDNIVGMDNCIMSDD